jgi:hypothetical protein
MLLDTAHSHISNYHVANFSCGHIQGGVMNRGLLFACPPPLPLGGCERKD